MRKPSKVARAAVPKKIIENWWLRFQLDARRLHPQVVETRKRVQQQLPNFTVWLGGPGRHSPFYKHRKLIKGLLERDGFRVYFSEDGAGGLNLPSREKIEGHALSLIIILVITVGAA